MRITGSTYGTVNVPEEIAQQFDDINLDSVEYHVVAEGNWCYYPPTRYDPACNEIDDIVLSVDGLAVFNAAGEDITDTLTNQQEGLIKAYIKGIVDCDSIHWEDADND